MATIYELKAQYMELLEMMKDPEVDPEVLRDTMEGLTGELEDKAEGYIVVSKELEGEAVKFEKEMERLAKIVDSLRNNMNRIKQTLFATMQETGIKKLQTEHFKLAIQKNGGMQPLKITGEVPIEYCRLEPDNKKIRDALKDGNLDFAHLEERGEHLSIR